MEEKTTKPMDKIEQPTRKPGWYNNFLWWCAGANRDVLRQCPTEWAKYAGMGGTIFSTACMAALSGGYAISYVFDNTTIAILFGLFWGFVIIFNLDRLIVNTMYSDGEVTISWKEFFSGLPRIIMAIFLGIVISTPLELKIYEKSINTEIKSLKEKKLKELLANDEAKLEEYNAKKDQILSRDIVDAAVGSAGAAYNEANSELTKLQTQYNQKQSSISNLITRRRHVSQVNNPKEFNRLSSAINRLVVERNKLRPRIAELQTQKATTDIEYRNAIGQNSQQKREDLKTIDTDITELKKKISDAEKEYEPQLRDEFDGFQGRMMAYSSLKNESSTWWAAFFISMLFIIIECAPTFMRMMVADGSYEKILEAERHRIRVMSDKRISDLNDSINTEVQISSEKNRHRLEAEVLANKELMEKIAKTQAELLQTAIDKWREEELAKINENPSAYIKTNSEQSKL
jgi:hypothetical protein